MCKTASAYVVTIPVSSGDNYNAYTITVTLTGSNKIMPTLTVNPINVTYTGKDVPASAIVGTAKDGDKTVSGTWSWGTGKSVPKNVADSGSYEVCFTPDDKAYLSGTTTVQVTIAKATPTGAPKYTSITTSGKNAGRCQPDHDRWHVQRVRHGRMGAGGNHGSDGKHLLQVGIHTQRCSKL